jgi:hypothetical protein
VCEECVAHTAAVILNAEEHLRLAITVEIEVTLAWPPMTGESTGRIPRPQAIKRERLGRSPKPRIVLGACDAKWNSYHENNKCALHRPNENKMSDGDRDRAWITWQAS